MDPSRADALSSGSRFGGFVLIANLGTLRPTNSVFILSMGSWELNVSDILDSASDCEHSCEGKFSKLSSSSGRVAFSTYEMCRSVRAALHRVVYLDRLVSDGVRGEFVLSGIAATPPASSKCTALSETQVTERPEIELRLASSPGLIGSLGTLCTLESRSPASCTEADREHCRVAAS